MHYTITNVTPEMAKGWLEENLENNRKVKQSVVDKYSRDMRSGNWRLTHEAIAFNTKGKLIDGQHRLWAVMLSGIAVQMLVANGVPDDAFDHIDQGLSRSALDIFKTQGRTWISKDDIAIARILRLGPEGTRGTSLSVDEIGSEVEKHKEAIEFVSSRVNKHRKLPAAVKAAIVAAWYYERDKEELARFIAVLSSGITQHKKDKVVIILRDFLSQEGSRAGGNKIRTVQFLKACRAIKAFMDDEDLARLYAVDPSPYPLPVIFGAEPASCPPKDANMPVTGRGKKSKNYRDGVTLTIQ